MNYHLGNLKDQMSKVLHAIRKNFYYWNYKSYRATLRSFGMDCTIKLTFNRFKCKPLMVYFAIDNKGNCVGKQLEECNFGSEFSFKGFLFWKKQSKKYVRQTLHLKALSRDFKKKMEGVTTVLEGIILCKELGVKLVRDSEIKLGSFYHSDRQFKVVLPLHKLSKPKELETFKISKNMYIELNTAQFSKENRRRKIEDSISTPIANRQRKDINIEPIFDFLSKREEELSISEQRFLKTIKLLGTSIYAKREISKSQSIKI